MTLSTEPVALAFYTAIIVTIFLSCKIIRRWNGDKTKENEKVGCFAVVYIFLVVGVLSSLFFPFVVILGQSTYRYIDFPRYESTVVDVESGLEEQRYTDSDGRSRTRKVMMHTAVVEFIDEDGNKIRKSNSIRSGGEPNIGDKITVSYKDGAMQEFSFRAIALFVGLAFMLLVMGYCLLLIYNYASRKSNDYLLGLGATFMFRFIIPGGMLLLFSGMLYGLIQYFMGNNDMPLVIVYVVIFFCVVLFFSFFGYLSLLFSKKERR